MDDDIPHSTWCLAYKIRWMGGLWNILIVQLSTRSRARGFVYLLLANELPQIVTGVSRGQRRHCNHLVGPWQIKTRQWQRRRTIVKGNQRQTPVLLLREDVLGWSTEVPKKEDKKENKKIKASKRLQECTGLYHEKEPQKTSRKLRKVRGNLKKKKKLVFNHDRHKKNGDHGKGGKREKEEICSQAKYGLKATEIWGTFGLDLRHENRKAGVWNEVSNKGMFKPGIGHYGEKG